MTTTPGRRRYVSVAAGTYPAPVRPHRAAVAAPIAAAAPPVPELDAEDEVFEARPATGPVPEPDLGALTGPPTTPELQDTWEPTGQAAEADVSMFGLTGEEPQDSQPASWARKAWRRMLLGGVLGVLAGVLVGMVLLALRYPGGLATLKDPVALWTSSTDSRDWLMVGLFGAGGGLLGLFAAASVRKAAPRG